MGPGTGGTGALAPAKSPAVDPRDAVAHTTEQYGKVDRLAIHTSGYSYSILQYYS